MNKTEKAVLQTVRENLNSQTGSRDGDTWEVFAMRMRETIKQSVKIMDSLLNFDPEDSEEETNLKLD